MQYNLQNCDKGYSEHVETYCSSGVSPYLTSFVLGRSIYENNVVAQELAHCMSKMRGRTSFFAIKVDLAKAYDRLNWGFILNILQEVGIPKNLIDIIMCAVISVQTNVKWNGSRAEYFSPHQGIRQGDPMSPYLFVMCIDKLSHLILEKVEEGQWKCLRAGRYWPMISHLMFADDLLLFGQALVEQMQCVLDVLYQFCELSGQQINNSKTNIMFSKNVGREMRDSLVSSLSGFKETSSMGKYLGVPLLGRAPKRMDYQFLIDQVKAKLVTWKAKHLSFAGKVRLAKSVIEAMPIYSMMTTSIPKSVTSEI